MKKINRRTFVSHSLLTAAALSVPVSLMAGKEDDTFVAEPGSPAVPGIIDTYVNLLEFPFRRLKFGETKSLVSKLRKHQVKQAWAGSFEALFHKDIDGVNSRLAEECRKNGKGMLLPFGTVNIAWADWEEDLRRCHEVYKMPGIRIYPIYQTFDLEHPEFLKLVQKVAERGMILQIVGDVEDIRHIHPIVNVRGINFEPLIDVMKKVPKAKVQLVYWNNRIGGNLQKLVDQTNIVFDISRIEGNGAVGRLIEGNSWSGAHKPVPVERFLFGSHAPYFPVETNIMKLFESPLTLEQMQAIMHVNARNFLKR
ncbi:MAG TPA: hypothetical protein VGD22_16605 [Sphingobacteriaceae bacterium]